jgi:hypothetical protein
MNRNRFAAGFVMAALALCGGCRKDADSAPGVTGDSDPVVARHAGGEIHRSEIRAAVERRLAAVPPPVAVETRRDIVRRVVERKVRIAAMRKAMVVEGYDARPESILRLRAAEERVLAAELLAVDLQDVKAADALVAEAVEQRLQSIHPEEARKFSHIFLRVPPGDAAALAKARAAMTEIVAAVESGTGFNTLAERHSDSVMARNGGRIEWTARKDLQPALAEVIFGLREGAMSPVIETKDGLHLFRLDGVRAGSAVDTEAVRRTVRQELDAEAVAVAERGLRQRTLDAAGAEFVSAARLEKLRTSDDVWVARWRGGEVRAPELLALAGPAVADAPPADAFLRLLVENRLLAQRRRETPLTPELEAKIEEAGDQEVLDAYRAHLVAGLDLEPTEAELRQFYDENRQAALFLRDYHLDLLFLPQAGSDVAKAYSAGEVVIAKLRQGATFESLLDRPVVPEARVCRDVHPIDVEALGKSFLRLRRSLLNLGVGDVSPALYFDGPRSDIAGGKCVLEGRGVVFARLREIGTLPFEAARGVLRTQVAEKKRRAGIDAIQARLVADSRLEILLPEG